MSDDHESRWRREFEQWGVDAVRRTVSGTSGWDEPRRQFAFRWLREKEGETEHRAEQVYHDARQTQQDTRRTMWLAVAAIVIAVVSLIIAIVK